jgi:HK97 family phage prohead protease
METNTTTSRLSADERRALVSRVGEEIRAMGEAQRSLSPAEQEVLTVCCKMYAACYAAMSYLCYYEADDLPQDAYSAFYEAYTCGSVLVSMLYRESALAASGAELCAAAGRQVEAIMAGSDDAVLTACAMVCVQCAGACEAMAAAGEGEEGRRAPGGREETRALKCELRSEGEGRKVVGYPIIFNDLSQDLGGFRERILPSAIQFDDDVRADFNHDANCILGRVRAGTLSLTIDTRGVRMEADLPEAPWADGLLASMRRGDIDQGSFAFRVLPGGQQIAQENGETIRTLSKILVRKVSVVSDPAYTTTSIEVRSNSNDAKPAEDSTAGQAAPTASSGGVGLDLLRRRLTLAAL